MHAAIRHGLIPILCVGETLAERDSGKTWDVIEEQLSVGLKEIAASGSSEPFIVAYEPVWAIGTGKTASKEQAQKVHKLIRDFISSKYGNDIASKVRILYGGSVKPQQQGSPRSADRWSPGRRAALDVMQFADIIRALINEGFKHGNSSLVVHYLLCFFLIVIILLQAGKGADIGALWRASQTVFGGRGPTTFLNKLRSAWPSDF